MESLEWIDSTNTDKPSEADVDQQKVRTETALSWTDIEESAAVLFIKPIALYCVWILLSSFGAMIIKHIMEFVGNWCQWSAALDPLINVNAYEPPF